MRTRCVYNRRRAFCGIVVELLLAQETCPIKNYFAHTRKKDLTFVAFALILAQSKRWKIVVVLLLARGRRPGHVKAPPTS